MTWLQRLRPAVYVLGAALVVATLLGARALTAGNGNGDDKKSVNPGGNGNVKVGGPVVLGTVDSKTPPVSYALPPVLQSGTIAEVFVEEGQEVKKGDKLYAFDTTIQKRNVEKAKAAVAMAKTKVDEAVAGKPLHEKQIAAMAQTLEAAKKKVETATRLYNLIKSKLEADYKDRKIDPKEWDQMRADNPDQFKSHSDYVDALSAQDRIQAELDILKATDPQLMVNEAEAGVKQAEAEVDLAQSAIDLCTIKAQTAGTIEQIKISPGSTLGISTRDPALWVIPAGPRVVRGEVEAEFAHRITADLIGKEVVISDHTDPKLTYKGIVRRVGGTFLPKRSAEGGFLSNDTRVLEAVVEVSDPAPAGKPPLRVGQRVRVNLGQ